MTRSLRDRRSRPRQAARQGLPPVVQLIDHRLLKKPVSRTPSDLACRTLERALSRYLEAHPVGTLYRAPFGIFLGPFDVFVPDLIVVLHPGKAPAPDGSRAGAPDLVVEVRTPANPAGGLGARKRIYGVAGARELWVVDPGLRTVDSYRFVSSRVYPAQTWSGERTLTSPLLPDLRIAVSGLFRRRASRRGSPA